jgi:zinc transport system substrate-binding protein
MKKIITAFLALLVLMCMPACGNTAVNTTSNNKIQIVTTIFPEYDWVKQILGDRAEQAEITMLLDNGVDLHSYQPTAEDIMKISSCDLFIHIGGESDSWVEAALQEASNDNMKALNLMDILGDSVKTEEVVEGMQEEDHHSHEDEINQEEIEDRTLSDFAGEWKSLYPLLLEGKLDAFCEQQAENCDDSAVTAEDFLNQYKTSWKTEVEVIHVENSQITFTYTDKTQRSAAYTYAGYQTMENEEGEIIGVRYQFETDSTDAPKYVQFNDHGYKPEESQHFHVYFGNESFEDLMKAETNPFFVKKEKTDGEIAEELMEHGHHHEEERDEHVWLSLKNAQIICKAISESLQEIDPDNKEVYSTNADAYIKELISLDEKYQNTVEKAVQKTILFGDRFPFRYLTDDYGLTYYAAFPGCSAESEASFETIVFLSGKVDELGLKNVLTIEKSDRKIAETIVGNTKEKNQKILALDSMQSKTSDDLEAGDTYLSVMENNLEVLKEVLQ